MIKKLLFTTVLILSGYNLINAQPCSPGNFTTPGIYPDTLTDLPVAVATVPYYVVMTAVIPVDTSIMGTTIPIDSIGVISIVGLPASLSWVSNSASNYWHGGTSGCVLITGTPTEAEVGIYSITINTKAYGGGLQLQQPVPGYEIVVLDSGNAGITNANAIKFEVGQNYPNPFAYKTNISFTAPVAETYYFTVYNIIGEVVYKRHINAEKGDNNIEFSSYSLTSGIYMYKLSNGEQTITKRMIIEGK